ncbi:hypothetical protein L6452_02295 [Arctium lappa]|uniref:Uncharacterized protein n=1 Tax=Arctium lappa TaxID=4217 RepID=A0ACB9FJ00_ARCLA|nr:hypothetical protein L6452_02295 [Arctium lappa]
MRSVQAKETSEGIGHINSGNEKEDNICKQMHIVQAKERGEGIDPKESVTEKDIVDNINMNYIMFHKRGFGLGKVVEEQTEEDIMEGYINRLHEKLSWMIAEKITIEATLNEAFSKFPDAEYFVEFKEKLESLFMVGRKNMDDEVERSLNKRTPYVTPSIPEI